MGKRLHRSARVAPGGERITIWRALADGKNATEMYILRTDGKDHPYTVSERFDAIVARKAAGRREMRVLIVFLLLATGLGNADTFLIKSTDGGRTWMDIDPGPPHQGLYWLRVDPRLSNLYALTPRPLGGQLLVSADRGQTWQTRQSFLVLPSGPWISRAAASAGTLYLAYEDPASIPQKSIMMARITNAGNDVLHYPAQGLTLDQFTLLDLAAPAEPTALYALIGNMIDQGVYVFQALWRSENGGRSWKLLEPPVRSNCGEPEFRVDPSGSRTYLLCGSDFFKSTDRGDSWTLTKAPDGGPIWNLEIGPGSPGTLYGVRLDEVWKSTDAAETWQRAGSLPGVGSLQAHPTNPSVIFAAGSRGIHKSEDAGQTWTTLLAAQLEYPGLLGIRVDPRTDTLYGIGTYQRLELRLHDRQTFLRNLLGEKQMVAGSLVSIYGPDLASEARVADSTPLPLSLGGASVLFNGQPAPLLFASRNQINAQLPFGLTGAVAMEVRRADATVDRQTINLTPRGVVILRQNSSRQADPWLFHASDFRRVTADDPARRGETITLFAIGMGELERAVPAGELPPTPPPQLRDPPCVTFSERLGSSPLASAAPRWAGMAPGMIGVYQVDFEIPASFNAASYTLSLTSRPIPLRPPFIGECSVFFQGAPLDSFTLEIQ